MHKKVLPFPAPRQVETPIACHHSRVNVRVGTQNFAIERALEALRAVGIPEAPASAAASHEAGNARSIGQKARWAVVSEYKKGGGLQFIRNCER